MVIGIISLFVLGAPLVVGSPLCHMAIGGVYQMRRSPLGLQREAGGRAAFCEFFGNCSSFGAVNVATPDDDTEYAITAQNSNINITYHIYSESGEETNSNTNQVVASTIELIFRKNVVGFVGPHGSAASKSVAPISSVAKAPMISYGGTSDELSDKEAYPQFFRTIPRDKGTGKAIAEFMAFSGWKTFCMINSFDTYGEFGGTEVELHAKSLGLSVATRQEMEVGEDDADEILPLLTAIKATGVRVVVLFLVSDDVGRVLKQAETLGLTGPGYTWISSGDFALDDFALHGLTTTTARGFISVDSFGGMQSTKLSNFQNTFANTYNQAGNIITDFKGESNEYEELPTDSAIPSNYNAYSQQLDIIGLFAYDAVLTLLTAMDTLAAQGFTPCTLGLTKYRQNLTSQIRQSSVTGLTGTVAFDSNQDRSNIEEYDIVNHDGTTWSRVATWHPTRGIEFLAGKTASNSPVWSTGETGISSAPPDTIGASAFVHKSYRIALVVLAAILEAIIVGLMVATYVFRDNLIVKAMSINMMQVINLGAMIALTSIFVNFPDPTDQSCQAIPVILHVSFAMVFGTLFAKNNRVKHIIVDRAGGIKGDKQFSDLAYARPVMGLIAMVGIYIIAWYSSDPPKAVQHIFQDESFQVCRSSSSWWYFSIIIFELAFLFYGATIAWQIRNVPSIFNEATAISTSLYSTLLISAVMLGILIPLGLNPDEFYAISSMGTIVILATVLTLLYGPRLYAVITKIDASEYGKTEIGSAGKPSKLSFRKGGGGGTGHTGNKSALGSAKNNPETARSIEREMDELRETLQHERKRSCAADREAEGTRKMLASYKSQNETLADKNKELEKIVVSLMEEKMTPQKEAI
ncbi:hypothetical protein AAMO2058_001181600 [Amorphochlora amoebiformis]